MIALSLELPVIVTATHFITFSCALLQYSMHAPEKARLSLE